jgi:hypothetical protein
MRAILVFAPYLLVPLALTLIFRKFKVSQSGWTYLLTVFILFFYPFGLFWLSDFMNPPPPGPKCVSPQVGFLMGNIIILLPISLILQFVFNKIFLISKNKSTGKAMGEAEQ